MAGNLKMTVDDCSRDSDSLCIGGLDGKALKGDTQLSFWICYPASVTTVLHSSCDNHF